MSVTDKIIQDNPTKYETLLEARILSKVLQMKINQYNALQNQYNNLLQTEINKGGNWTDQVNIFVASNDYNKWKILGTTDNLTDCKLKAIQDESNAYSSVVYLGPNTMNKNVCYGMVKGGTTSSWPATDGVISSLAPNGTTRMVAMMERKY